MMRRVTNYRRNFVPGGTFFFTVNLADRQSRMLTERVALLREAFRYARARRPFTLDAVVVLPDHLHAIWTLPSGDADYSTRWRLIKAVFSRGIEPVERRSKSRAAKGERGIWQRRYWEHTLRDERDFERHCDYIHFNPVKHGYVRAAHEWPHSSLRRFLKLGIYPADWASGEDASESDFGER
jgi:putative transposase